MSHRHPMSIFQPDEEASVYTVSELNRRIKGLLESNFPLVWVKGEISNLRIPTSGHSYFTLKDDLSQIRAVFFRTQQRHLRFQLESGLQVICQARVSVYEPRGETQLIVELMEPQGIGALQLAFEQLKKKLDGEGLFDPERKLAFPVCPRNIGIVTSPTGAAVRDILKVLQRSPFSLCVTVFPVRVQGVEAAEEIAAAIVTANALAEHFQWDLLIVGRGGGSMEDLWPFNEEVVARAMADSTIPIISAVGHEIDFTISDLVADLRMPTPTAAAEWVVGRLDSIVRDLTRSRDRLCQLFAQRIDAQRQRLHYLCKRLVHPGRKLEDLRISLDERLERLQLGFLRRIEKLRTAQTHLMDRLLLASPSKLIERNRGLLVQDTRVLVARYEGLLEKSRLHLAGLGARLGSLNPLSVLDRGYSIAYRLPEEKILRDSAEVAPGQDILVQLARGKLTCKVVESE